MDAEVYQDFQQQNRRRKQRFATLLKNGHLERLKWAPAKAETERRRRLQWMSSSGIERDRAARCSPALLDLLLSQLEAGWEVRKALARTAPDYSRAFLSPTAFRMMTPNDAQLSELMNEDDLPTLISGIEMITTNTGRPHRGLVLDQPDNMTTLVALCSQLRSFHVHQDAHSPHYFIMRLSEHAVQIGRHLNTLSHSMLKDVTYRTGTVNSWIVHRYQFPAMNRLIRSVAPRLNRLSLNFLHVMTYYYGDEFYQLPTMNRLKSLAITSFGPEDQEAFRFYLLQPVDGSSLTSFSLRLSIVGLVTLFSFWLSELDPLKHSIERLSLRIADMDSHKPFPKRILKELKQCLKNTLPKAVPTFGRIKTFELSIDKISAEKPFPNFAFLLKLISPHLVNLTSLYLEVRPDYLPDQMLPINFKAFPYLEILKYYCPFSPAQEIQIPIEALFNPNVGKSLISRFVSRKFPKVAASAGMSSGNSSRSCRCLSLTNMPSFTSGLLRNLSATFPALQEFHFKASSQEFYRDFGDSVLAAFVQQLPELRTLRFNDDHAKPFSFSAAFAIFKQRADERPVLYELRIPLNEKNQTITDALIAAFGPLERLNERLRIY